MNGSRLIGFRMVGSWASSSSDMVYDDHIIDRFDPSGLRNGFSVSSLISVALLWASTVSAI